MVMIINDVLFDLRDAVHQTNATHANLTNNQIASVPNTTQICFDIFTPLSRT